jgi:hypothetical protein
MSISNPPCEKVILCAGKDFLLLEAQDSQNSMKSPVSSLTSVQTPVPQCSAQSKLCLDTATLSESMETDHVPNTQSPLFSSFGNDVERKRLFIQTDVSSTLCDKTGGNVAITRPKTSIGSTKRMVQDWPESKLHSTAESSERLLSQSSSSIRFLPSSARRKMPNHEPSDQNKHFWDWLEPSKSRDAVGRRCGEEGYDPSTIMIPPNAFDQMTG